MKKRNILPVLAAAVLAACGSAQKQSTAAAATKTAAEPVEVRLAVAETRKVERAINVTGTLHPDESVAVSSEVAGRVVSMHADYGQSVKKGEVIAEIDKQEYQIQIDRTRAAMAQALARIGLRPEQENETPSTTPAIRQAKAQYEDMRAKFESAEQLLKTGDIARERYTEAEKALAARKASLDAAEDDLRMQLANLQSLRAERRLAEKRLRDTTIRAPFDGSVQEKMVSAGQYLKENTPLVRLVKSWPLRLRLDVPEVAAGVIRIGDRLSFTTEAIPGKQFAAVVRELNPSLDSRSRSLNAEARLLDSGAELRPGMFVQIRLVIQKDVEIVVVPKEALYQVAGLTKLFTVQDGKAREHRIPAGATQDGWAEVPREAAPPGATVAVEKLAQLTDGALVKGRM